MKLIPLIVVGYALWNYLKARKNLQNAENNAKSQYQDQLDKAYSEIDEYEKEKEDLMQEDQGLNSETMSAYLPLNNVILKPEVKVGLYRNNENGGYITDITTFLTIKNNTGAALNIKNIAMRLFVRSSSYLRQFVEENGLITEFEDYDNVSYAQIMGYVPVKFYTDITIPAGKKTEQMYMPAMVVADTATRELPYVSKDSFLDALLNIADAEKNFFGGSQKDYATSNDGAILNKQDKGVIDEAFYGIYGYGVMNHEKMDFMYADVEFEYEDTLNNSGKKITNTAIFKRIPVIFSNRTA